MAPNVARYRTTAAAHEYSAGNWAKAKAECERAMALGSGKDPVTLFLLALVHERKAEHREARNWFDKAVACTGQNATQSGEMLRLWSDAAKLLGLPGPPAADQAGTGAPAC
jgi:hypothetical protein